MRNYEETNKEQIPVASTVCSKLTYIQIVYL